MESMWASYSFYWSHYVLSLDSVKEQWVARPNDCSLNFLLVIIPPQTFLALIPIYLGSIILALKKYFLEVSH